MTKIHTVSLTFAIYVFSKGKQIHKSRYADPQIDYYPLTCTNPVCILYLYIICNTVTVRWSKRGFLTFQSSTQSAVEEFPTPADTGFIQSWPFFVQQYNLFSSPLASLSVPLPPALLPASSKSFFDGFPSNLSTATTCARTYLPLGIKIKRTPMTCAPLDPKMFDQQLSS